MNLSRRTFLRGLGTAIALPTLESVGVAASAAPPARLAFLFVPNGMSMDQWRPGKAGALATMPELLKPLEPLRKKVTVLSGLTQVGASAQGDGPGDHARSAAAWLTGVHPRKTAGEDIRAGVSVDQIAAGVLGKNTKFASLELGCERGGLAGNCDSGYSCAYSSTISWRTESTPLAKEINPRLVFERLFGASHSGETAEAKARRNRQNASILDFVLEDTSDLQKRLSERDAKKLDEYMTGIREIEERLVKFEKNRSEIAVAAPVGIPSDFGEHIRLMGDMMILAFQADLTRVCSFMFANEGSNRPYPFVGVNDGHHEMSHHGKDPQKLAAKLKIDQFHIAQLAYILQRMDQVQEQGGTLLDNTFLVFGAGISDGDRHNHDDLPILMAGRGGTNLRTGQHLVYENGTPMSNLFLSLLDRVGVRLDKFGDSTGQLNPLF